ncbi:MAG TPA: ATP-binding cassette domain-containing protein [Candidatus Krumholzibacteria bacterium]|nr:ATP-binding cassette domain-containing protein [Candidatus Krumholzibacteria bacterium]HPD71144.1 ATP-binding cassette domain-containing protein [Candidatus Krumholzibacteria bacterium]HRY39156.1 ATP-binding cassette domain-containing protein [Candidatus Krumholzibacteria bacterium]
MAPLITVDRLTKDYRLTVRREGVKGGIVDLVRPRKRILRAVDEVSFTIDPGEMVGYIGANGAGKSTTIKVLTGILTPTSGEVRVGGLVPYRQRQSYTRHIGVVFGQRTQLWWDLAVVESFRLLQRIFEVPEDRYRSQMAFFAELLGIDEFLNQPVRKLSLGQRMRCDLAAALVHEPRVLFLDEPTIGLDVVAKENVRGFLRRARDTLGVTVILTTHDLGDIEQLCRRVIIIDHGKVLYDGLLEDLRRGPGHRLRLCLDLAEPVTAAALAAATRDLPVQWESDGAHRHCALFSRAETTAAAILSRVLAAHRLRDMALTEPAIEDVVRRIYREGLQPGQEANLE